MPTVAYQGHPGAYSDVAARALVPEAETRGYPSFDAAAEAIARGEVDFAVLPVENAIAGPVPRNYELLWEHPELRIRDETMLAIELCLIGVEGATESTVAEVRSHPVALEQVRRMIDARGWRRSTTTDTAGAVREVVELGDAAVAAIGPALAAEIYGGTILARGVQDESENYTRFFLIERDGGAPFDKLSSARGAGVTTESTTAVGETTGSTTAVGDTTESTTTVGETRGSTIAVGETTESTAAVGVTTRERACIGIAVEDRTGSLRDALSAFADRGIDLRFLIARPDRRVPFRYRFFVELTNVDDARLDAALAAIGGEQRVLGRY